MATRAVTDRLRADAMARRIDRTADRLGLGAGDRLRLRKAFELGMEPRFEREFDDHHPDYLHPARTALILLDDAGVTDTATLAAALVTETRDPGLALRSDPAPVIGDDAAAVVTGVVEAGADEVGGAERLVTASRAICLVAVAERLDHARHLHLRDRREWSQYHERTCALYGPVALRVDAVLARRIAWWCTTFRRRFLEG